ncbi:MAG: dTMP kinase [Candidatus Cloacimonetes bacterium]|nr:dTMP kinase [Candidatus Cloacimonadota bacterium]
MRGLFITFEGIEGCGKSTQVKLLAEWLRATGREVLLTREPGGPVISEEIRRVLLNPDTPEMLPETELLLYMASRSQHTGELIIPALESGQDVISDRYYDSTIAYQGAARNIDLEWIKRLTDYATYSLKPDITFLLDISVEESTRRLTERCLDRIEKEKCDFHQKVREGFLTLANSEPERFKVLDGTAPIDVISIAIINETEKYMKRGL